MHQTAQLAAWFYVNDLLVAVVYIPLFVLFGYKYSVIIVVLLLLTLIFTSLVMARSNIFITTLGFNFVFTLLF